MPTNFLSPSNGIEESLLKQIDASPDEVLSGVKYLGSDGIIHTGTYTPPNKTLKTSKLLDQTYSGNQTLDIDCKSIPGYADLSSSNFVMAIVSVSNGRTDFGDRNDSAATYTGIKVNAANYVPSTGKYHIEIRPQYTTNPASTYTANTMTHWNGNEAGASIIKHLNYRITLTVFYIS